MTTQRISLLVLSLAIATFSACSYDPKVDANGFKCQSNGDCPSGFSCVKASGAAAGVCCNRTDAAACLPPAKDAASDPAPVSHDLRASDSVLPDLAAPDLATPDAPGVATPDAPGVATPDAPVTTDTAGAAPDGGQSADAPLLPDVSQADVPIVDGGAFGTGGASGGSTGNGGTGGGGGTIMTGGATGSGGQGCQQTLCGTSCVNLDSDAHNCGRCGADCGMATCGGGICGDVEVISGLYLPDAIAVTDHYLFVNANGTRRLPKDGSSSTAALFLSKGVATRILGSGNQLFYQSGQNVYSISEDAPPPATTDAGVSDASVGDGGNAGGPYQVLTNVTSWTIAGGKLYWTKRAMYTCTHCDCPVCGAGGCNAYAMACDPTIGTYLLGSTCPYSPCSLSTAGSILASALDGSAMETIHSGKVWSGSPGGISVSGNAVYWTSLQGTGTSNCPPGFDLGIMRTEIGADDELLIAKADDVVDYVSVAFTFGLDNKYLYFNAYSIHASGSTCSATGGFGRVIATGGATNVLCASAPMAKFLWDGTGVAYAVIRGNLVALPQTGTITCPTSTGQITDIVQDTAAYYWVSSSTGQLFRRGR
jgi:hypothetical protein